MKLGGGDRDLVEKGLVPEEEPKRHDGDPFRLEDGLRQVARGVRHERDAARRRKEAQVLGAHVLDLRLDDVAETADDREGVLGAIHVYVDTQPRSPAHDRNRVAEGREGAAQRVAVEPCARHERLRAVAKEDRLAGLADPGFDAVLGRRGGRRHAAPECRDRPFDEEDESLRTRVHDARAAQDLELIFRPKERAFRFRRRERKQDRKVGRFGRAPDGFFRECGDDAQNRALARPRHGLARSGGACGGRGAEFPRREILRAGYARGESLEELREDRAGIPPRSHESLVGRKTRNARNVPYARADDRRRNARERCREVRACIVVGHRKHIDAVQLRALRRDRAGSCHEGARKAPPVQVRDADAGHSENSIF